MKKISSNAGSIIFVISTGCIFGCSNINFPPDPYYVDPERQNENVYHTPSTPNAPLLTKKGSFSFSGHYGGNKNFYVGNIQAAYLPGKKLGLMANFKVTDYRDRLYSSINGGIDGIELGIGYIMPSLNSIHLETYAGMGNTSIKNVHHTGSSKVGINHYFFQPAVYYGNHSNTFQVAFVPRISLNNFTVKSSNFNSDREQIVQNQFNLMNKNGSQYMFEPTILLRGGSEFVKFQLAYTFSKNLTEKDLNQSKRNLSIGVVLIPIN